MNLLLLGYGKMGKAIEEIALDRGHTIIEKIDVDNREILDKLSPEMIDAAIEFSQPDAAYDNISHCLMKGIRVVSGTTGWLDKRKDIEKLCKEKKGTFFYASNFSIGVNLFFKLNRYLAGLMKGHGQYGIEMTEIHHTEKKDAPSGTAITLTEGIISENDQYTAWIEGLQGKKEEIGILSKREGKVPGTHIIRYTSEMDEIEIKHEALTRKGFALGAVMVAEWISNRSGLLTMDDFLEI